MTTAVDVEDGDGPAVDVSVIIPHYQTPGTLRLVLQALGHQSLAEGSFEVVIADDGSAPGLTPAVPPDLPFPVAIASHERKGARRGEVRNLGVSHARGSLLAFLDADMVPDPGWLAAHVMVHRTGVTSVVVGERMHVSEHALDDALLNRLLQGRDGLRAVAEHTETTRPEWRHAIVRDTDDLQASGARGWRVAGGGNLSLPRTLYDRVGGFSQAFEGWGGEDLEFAYRTFIAGARFVWEPRAFAVHLGMQATPSRTEVAELLDKERVLADRVADPSVRSRFPVRSWSVPAVSVEVACDADGPATCAAIDSVLRAEVDVRVLVTAAQPEVRELVARSYAADGRVVTAADPSDPDVVWAPVRGRVVRPELSAEAVRTAIAMVGPASTSGHSMAVIRDGEVEVAAFDSVPLHNAAATPKVAVISAGAHDPSSWGAADLDDLALQQLRNLFWRLSPRQRRLLSRTVRMVIDVIASLARLRPASSTPR